jgi:hypothetical protein
LNNLKQRDCTIDWSLDSAEKIARKIQSRDSQSGLFDSIYHTPVYLYGAHLQPLLTPFTVPPKTLLSCDKGAFLFSTIDPYNALWITHLINPVNKQNLFKLPATMVIPPIFLPFKNIQLFKIFGLISKTIFAMFIENFIMVQCVLIIVFD